MSSPGMETMDPRAKGHKRYENFVKVFREANPEMQTAVQYREAQRIWNEVKNNENKTAGINMNDGTIGDMSTLGIRECLRVKQQALISACEAAEMILRCDKLVQCAPRERNKMGLHN